MVVRCISILRFQICFSNIVYFTEPWNAYTYDREFTFFDERKNHSEADVHCKNANMFLAKIDSKEINDLITAK